MPIGKYTRPSLEVRFWNKVDKNGPTIRPELSPCWMWLAGTGSKGYGQIGYRGRMVSGHRISWELNNGTIPVGLSVLHKCDNPPCVNPDHLFLGTMKDNMHDKIAKGRGRNGAPPRILTVEQIQDIRTRHSAGESRKTLALKHNITPRKVTNIARGRLYARVK